MIHVKYCKTISDIPNFFFNYTMEFFSGTGDVTIKASTNNTFCASYK